MQPRPYVAYLGGFRPRRYAVLEVRTVTSSKGRYGRSVVLSRHFTHEGARKKLHEIRRSRRMTA